MTQNDQIEFFWSKNEVDGIQSAGMSSTLKVTLVAYQNLPPWTHIEKHDLSCQPSRSKLDEAPILSYTAIGNLK